MKKDFTIEELVERYKVLTPFERIELSHIIGGFEMKSEYEEQLSITTPNVKEIFENYIEKSCSERMEFNHMVEAVE